MKVAPAFNGKIYVTSVKDENWTRTEYQTSKSTDRKILNAAKKVCPDNFTIARQPMTQEDGEYLRSVIEKEIGEKLDIPEDAIYSALFSENYNEQKKKNNYSVHLFGDEKYGSKGRQVGDRTAIDIYI